MRFPTMWYVRPATPQLRLRVCWSLEYSMIVKLLTEHHLEFLSLKGGCRGSSESTHVKIPHCWKSHTLAQLLCGGFPPLIVYPSWTLNWNKAFDLI